MKTKNTPQFWSMAIMLLSIIIVSVQCSNPGPPPTDDLPTEPPPTTNPEVCNPRVEAASRRLALAQPLAGERVPARVILDGQPPRNVSAIVEDGFAFVEGDILLGQVTSDKALVTSDTRRRWTNATMPYVYHAGYVDNGRVARAMQEWTAKTGFRFVPRTTETNYIIIQRNISEPRIGRSSVGMAGGVQAFLMGDECDYRVALHELGHALGLWHEQSRPDRDRHICIRWSAIKRGTADQFDIKLSGVTPIGGYDYDSIMHYYDKAFGDPQGTVTMVSKDPRRKIRGQQKLSAGDIAAIKSIYRLP